jgi:hypothetical protein
MSTAEGAEEFRRHILRDWPAALRAANDIFQNKFYDRLQGIIACLEPIGVLQLSFQDLKKPTSSRAIGLLHRTKEILESVVSGVVGVAELATALLTTLETRTGHYFTTITNCLNGSTG